MNNLDLKPKELAIVKSIIQKYLIKTADGSKVYIFGSRATGNAKKYSDLDLAFDLKQPMSLALTADLREDFDNSDLPYSVDIVDLNSIDPGFKKTILSASVQLFII